MISKNELRLGNLVNEEVLTELTIVGLLGNICRADNKGEDCHLSYDSLMGIPLTEEWLVRFGFVKKEDGFYYLDIGNDTMITSGGKEFWIDKIVEGVDVSVGLGGGNAVHQLQNLYHAMANKELILRNYLSFTY